MQENSFNHSISKLAKFSFVILVWAEGALFSLDAGSSHFWGENGVDKFVIDAYELAICKYGLSHPKEEQLIEKFRISIQEDVNLAEWRNKVSEVFMFFYFFFWLMQNIPIVGSCSISIDNGCLGGHP